MKKSWTITFALYLFLLKNVFAMVAPGNVQASFDKMFPNARAVHWHKEHANEYEAEFIWNGYACSANFNASGQWLETETEIGLEQVPSTIVTAFIKLHKETSLRKVYVIKSMKGETHYEMEYRKGLFNKEVLFDEQGNLIK